MPVNSNGNQSEAPIVIAPPHWKQEHEFRADSNMTLKKRTVRWKKRRSWIFLRKQQLASGHILNARTIGEVLVLWKLEVVRRFPVV